MEHKSQPIGAEHYLTRSRGQHEIGIHSYVHCFEFPSQSAQVTYNKYEEFISASW